jgi:HSP20 family protein
MMTRMRWMPFEHPAQARRNRAFNELWRPFPFEEAENHPAAPALDVLDYEDRVEVLVNLPGVAPDSVAIEFEKGMLTIASEAPAEPEGRTYTRRERYQGAYRRSVRVSDSLDIAQASAHFEHGVLTLSLPKKAEAQPVKIKVNAVV